MRIPPHSSLETPNPKLFFYRLTLSTMPQTLQLKLWAQMLQPQCTGEEVRLWKLLSRSGGLTSQLTLAIYTVVNSKNARVLFLVLFSGRSKHVAIIYAWSKPKNTVILGTWFLLPWSCANSIRNFPFGWVFYHLCDPISTFVLPGIPGISLEEDSCCILAITGISMWRWIITNNLVIITSVKNLLDHSVKSN